MRHVFDDIKPCKYYRETNASPYCTAVKWTMPCKCGGDRYKCMNKDRKEETTMEFYNREDILDGAKDCVCKSREADYSSPENSFKVIASMWTSYLYATGKMPEDNGVVLTAKDVAAMMVLFKMSRVATGCGKVDNWIDAAGYAACGGEIEQIPNSDVDDF